MVGDTAVRYKLLKIPSKTAPYYSFIAILVSRKIQALKVVMGLIAHLNTLIGQLLIPRHVFDHLMDSLAGQGPRPSKFSYWSQSGAMLYAQWSSRKSLRDLVFSLNRRPRSFTIWAALKRNTPPWRMQKNNVLPLFSKRLITGCWNGYRPK